MRVFAYAFKSGKWVETPRLSVRDVALLVDTEGRTIYIWNGPKSKVKDQSEARKLLLSLRDRYSSFEFQRVGRNPAPELQAEIKRLLGSPLGQGKTRVFAIASMIAGIVGIGLAIFIIFTLFDPRGSEVNNDGYVVLTLFETRFEVFHPWLESISLFTIMGMIAFGVSLLFAALSKRTFIAVTTLIGLVMGILCVLYISFWRPGLATGSQYNWTLTLFQTFQTLVLLFEIIAFVPFTIGLIAELYRIVTE